MALPRRIPFSFCLDTPDSQAAALGPLVIAADLSEHSTRNTHRPQTVEGMRVMRHMFYAPLRVSRAMMLSLTSKRRYHLDINIHNIPPDFCTVDAPTVELMPLREINPCGIVTEQIYRSAATAFEAAPVQPRALFTSEHVLKIMITGDRGFAVLRFRTVRGAAPPVQLRFRVVIRRQDGSAVEFFLRSQAFTITRTGTLRRFKQRKWITSIGGSGSAAV